MAQTKVLVVDDDFAVRNLVHRYLANQGYQVESAADGESALERFDQFNPNLVVLDVNLPDVTGYRLCQEMRERTNAFVLMLTCRTDEEDIIRGFNHRADDYVTKPFSLGVLERRIEAILGRSGRDASKAVPQILTFTGLTIDPQRHEVTVNHELVSLTALEFNLLHFLAKNPGRVWKREELIQKVWDYDFVGDDYRVVDVHIGQLRRKIEADTSKPQFIHTVRGVGYKFEAPKSVQVAEAS